LIDSFGANLAAQGQPSELSITTIFGKYRGMAIIFIILLLAVVFLIVFELQWHFSRRKRLFARVKSRGRILPYDDLMRKLRDNEIGFVLVYEGGNIPASVWWIPLKAVANDFPNAIKIIDSKGQECKIFYSSFVSGELKYINGIEDYYIDGIKYHATELDLIDEIGQFVMFKDFTKKELLKSITNSFNDKVYYSTLWTLRNPTRIESQDTRKKDSIIW